MRRETWETPDGDIVAVDWLDGPSDAPLVILFHGLESSSRGHYALALGETLWARGWRGCFPNFRGCGGLPNRLPRTYHAGDSAEIGWMLERAAHTTPGPVFAVGVSLGGNVLLKWLGESGPRAERWLQAAAAVCAPLDLSAVGRALDGGAARIYGRYFLRQLKSAARRRLRRFPGLLPYRNAMEARTLRDFDDALTAPLHGFAGVDDYWRRSSSGPWLRHVTVPTLLLASRDDPIVPFATVAAQNLGPAIHPCFTERGGHVGFVEGPFPGRIDWLPRRLLEYFAPYRGPET